MRSRSAWRWLRRALLGTGAAALLLLLLLPSPIDPLPYRPEPPVPFEGALAPNDALARAATIGDGRLNIPEDVAFDSAGRLYTATGDGRILRITRSEGRERIEHVATVGGHPLGLVAGPGDMLYVANHGIGLQAVAPDGRVRLLTDNYRGRPIRFADDLDIASDGIIYFSDASARFNSSTLETGPPYLPLDMLEARPHGALYAYDLSAGETRLVMDGLHFANGVALTRDEQAVLVVETPRYHVRRIWLRGPRAGQSDILIGRIPGLADGLSSDRAGHLYLSIQTPRSPLLDNLLHPRPWLKAQLTKLPQRLWARPRRYGLVVIYDEASGRPVASLHDPRGERVFSVANAVPHARRLWLGSLSNDRIAAVPNPVATGR